MAFGPAFAQSLAGLEMRHALGGNLNGLAGAGVAAYAGLAVIDGKAAKAANFNAVTAHQSIAHCIQNGFDGQFGIALVELAKLGGKFFDEIGSGHRDG